MKKWLIAGAVVVAFGLGGSAAFATKQIQTDVGAKNCMVCHKGSPKAKVFQPKVKAHIECALKEKKTCKSCHEGKPKGKTPLKCK